ncbi:hypothetical protein [Corynebacterium sp. H78]|uniref:hypothetical protein n=1 Tax=Corynebacterium sp. H78 TaxID=3133417 RepID=UPI00309A7A35
MNSTDMNSTNRDRFLIPTGKSGSEWVEWLNEKSASNSSHTDIVYLVLPEIEAYHHASAPAVQTNAAWWAQGVTVFYEQAIGRREVGQRCTGDWSASASKTLPGDMTTVRDEFNAFMNQVIESGALDIEGKPSISDTEKWRYWRCSMADGTRVDVVIQDKKPGKDGVAKAGLAVNHNKLDSAEARDSAKAMWKELLSQFASSRS